MSEHDIGRLLYLILLLAVVGGFFLLQGRRRLGQMAQQLLIWALIIVGLSAGWVLWQDVAGNSPRQSVVVTGETIEVPRERDGHYYLTLELNGAPVRFVVDTGATDVVLSQADARSIGIDPESLRYSGTARTANGTVRTAPIRIDQVRLGEFTDRGLMAWVNEGTMDISLLGMTYLQRFARIEIARDRLILTR